MSIEFAFVFPALFLIFYAIVTYGLIFAAKQTLTLAAAEGARAGLRYQAGDDPTTLKKRTDAAMAAAAAPVDWLNPLALTVTATSKNCNYNAALACIEVGMRYDYKTYPLIPRILLPTPDVLTSSAVVQVNASAF